MLDVDPDADDVHRVGSTPAATTRSRISACVTWIACESVRARASRLVRAIELGVPGSSRTAREGRRCASRCDVSSQRGCSASKWLVRNTAWSRGEARPAGAARRRSRDAARWPRGAERPRRPTSPFARRRRTVASAPANARVRARTKYARTRSARGRAARERTRHPREHLEVAVRDLVDPRQPDRRTAAPRARRRVGRARQPTPPRRRTGRLRHRRARDGPRSCDRRRAARLRVPRGARSSTDRFGWARDTRRSAAAPPRAAPSRSGRAPGRARRPRPCGRRTSARSARGRDGASSHARTSPPLLGLSDQLDAMTRTRLPCERLSLGGWVEDRRVDRVRDQMRLHELDAEIAVRVEAVPRLDDRRGRELGVDLGDALVGAVVEAAIRPDRAVHAVDEADVVARESAEAAEVEVERVDEADGGAAGDRVRARPSSPRRSSSATSARRNWCPPPVGGGANSWKSARSAAPRPRRVPHASTSVAELVELTREATRRARNVRAARAVIARP